MEDTSQPAPQQGTAIHLAMGRRFRAARHSWGLRLEDAATWTGLSVARIMEIESGRGPMLFVEAFYLSRLYWVSLDYLACCTWDRVPKDGWAVGHWAFDFLLKRVRAVARAGAVSVITNELVVREATERAIERLEEAVLTGKRLRDPRAWAFRIGQCEARRLSERRKTVSLDGESKQVQVAAAEELDGDSAMLVDRAELKQELADRRELLSEKQWEGVETILTHGSLKAAARALGKTPSNLRGIFKRALARLRGGGARAVVEHVRCSARASQPVALDPVLGRFLVFFGVDPSGEAQTGSCTLIAEAWCRASGFHPRKSAPPPSCR